MNTTFDLSQLDWNLTGWMPYFWKLGTPVESATAQAAEIHPIPAKIPGSVQKALLDAGIIEDWNKGTNYRDCQWVENLHWIYETVIPKDMIQDKKHVVLHCEELDGSGWIYLNKQQVAEFNNSFVPCIVDLSTLVADDKNLLQIIFNCPPRWLGQCGYTSQMMDFKTRFYYTWDWTSRLVQTGVAEKISLKCWNDATIEDLHLVTSLNDSKGTVHAGGRVLAPSSTRVRISISHDGQKLASKIVSSAAFNSTGVSLDNLDVELWWPNLYGNQPLYNVDIELIQDDNTIQTINRRVGFRDVEWKCYEKADACADPWICEINGTAVFLQGANWVPIRPNYADVTVEDYRQRLELYKDLGFNILRIWGGAVLEKEVFYDICDELGIMVWQEFPLSSSGLDNAPPEDELFILKMTQVARSYIFRRQHHTSLIIWCGGNELIHKDYVPLSEQHPMLKALGEVVRECDPSRRYLPTSPSGPKCHGTSEDCGKGLHWDVHGPWKNEGTFEEWESYWNGDDALFRSETGCPGASSADILEEFKGGCDIWPIDSSNPYWRRHTNWWIDYPNYIAETGNQEQDLEAYCQWSQERQKKSLAIAVSACKRQFPACGGVILWMGHDCFPCSANTSVIDYYGRPKPAAIAIGEIFKSKV